MVWSRVRKRGQVEKNVSAVARGWEEFRSLFPYLGHDWRRGWSERQEVKQWLEGGEEEEKHLEFREVMSKARASAAKHEQVEKWLRGVGGQE